MIDPREVTHSGAASGLPEQKLKVEQCCTRPSKMSNVAFVCHLSLSKV